MGIKGGGDIKKDLREGYDKVLFQETAHRGGVESELYTRAHARVYDCMLEMYYRPPHCTTGAYLVDWFWRTRVQPALMAGQVLVLIFDNQLYTPKCKAACQAKRRTKVQQLPTDLAFSDDCVLPTDWYALMATSKLRGRMFEYLIGSLQHRISSILPHEKAPGSALYCNLPYLEDADGGTSAYSTGRIIELTDTGMMPLPETVQGEGDLLCKIWVNHLAPILFKQHPTEEPLILVKTKDWDTVCAFLTTPPTCRVCVHVGDHRPTKRKDQPKDQCKDQRKRLEFVDIRQFWTQVLRDNQQLGVNYVLANILSGSDYCEGVYGVSGRSLLRTLLKMEPVTYAVSIREDGHLVIGQSKLRDWITASKRSKARPTRHQPYMLRRAFWNLSYWFDLGNIPDPLVYGGWDRTPAGAIMPVPDT